MAKKKIVKEEERDEHDSRLFAFLATFLSIIGFVIALVARRDDKYVMFYAKQSLIVFIVSIVLGVIGKVFLVFPVIGPIINVAVGIIGFILWLISWIYALSGEMKEVPVVGHWGRKFNL